ncbi:TPA: hypothetical protein DEP96_02155 [Candidatus Uhrbacteria bacterium]|nr:hypothetical protein [Candidatus Uhrbacteria bacterium]
MNFESPRNQLVLVAAGRFGVWVGQPFDGGRHDATKAPFLGSQGSSEKSLAPVPLHIVQEPASSLQLPAQAAPEPEQYSQVIDLLEVGSGMSRRAEPVRAPQQGAGVPQPHPLGCEVGASAPQSGQK